MKLSPLQLESPEYPVISVRSVPGLAQSQAELALPVKVSASVLFDSDLTHFAYLTILQEEDGHPYKVDIQVYAAFRIDIEGCRNAYKSAFNPQVVGVNVARVLYSGAREMLSLMTSRAPYGTATLPSLMIEPSDVELSFETGKMEEILEQGFGFDPDQLHQIRALFEEEPEPAPKAKKPRKVSAKARESKTNKK